MNDEYESRARSEENMASAFRDKKPREVITIVLVTASIMLYLEWTYDYINYVLSKLSTLPFWFVCYAIEYWLLQFLGNFQFTKSNIFCASCLGVDMMVLTGYAMGRMTIGGYLMIAFAIGFLTGPVLAILVEHMDENRKKNTNNHNKLSMDCFLTATLNRNVAVYSFLFLMCMSILNGWLPRF